MVHRKLVRRVGSALVVGSLVAALGTPAPVRAQEPSPGAAEAPTSTSLGLQDVAKATALTIQVAPTVGNLALAIKIGTSVAELRNRLAQSQSHTVDLGLLGGALTGEGCDGNATIRPEDLPQPLRIDNRGGDAATESVEADPAGGAGQLLQQVVRATAQPLASATTTTLFSSLGVLRIRGGQSVATVEVVDDGAARVAHAVSQFDVAVPGLLTLAALKWEAYHRTGTNPDAWARFSIGAVEVLGQSIPIADLPVADILRLVNGLLDPLGVQLGVPEVERFTEPADLIRISPLVIRTAPSDLRTLLLGPLFDGTRELRDGISTALLEASCDLSSAVLVSEIVMGQVSGIGTTHIALGGAEAITGQVDAGNALEDPVDDIFEEPSAPPVDVSPVLPGPGVDVPVRTPPPAEVASPPVRPSPRTQPIGTFERVCESVHPFGWPRCSEGVAPFVGLGGILAVLALGAYDFLHQQRLRRKPAADEVAP